MRKKKDENARFMRLALRLAKRAEGMTSPNPLVGAVLVKKGEIIGQGYHKRAGSAHAEIEAINHARKKRKVVKGATLYVNLEPCCHDNKRTPPCTGAVIESGISRVFVGTYDQNPKVYGNGVSALRKAGIDVEIGLLEQEAKEVNKMFFKYIKENMPYVVLKLAATLDGKIAANGGDSKWIGSTKQREKAHQLRNKMDCVLVGINTVIKDNPSLNVRTRKKNVSQPVPVVLDSRLRVPLDSNIFKVHKSCIVVTSRGSSEKKKKLLERRGVKVLYSKVSRSGKLSLKSTLKQLSDMEYTSVLIEGGGKVASSAINEGVVDEVVLFYSPIILGGDGISMISGLAIDKVRKAVKLKDVSIKRYGSELMIKGNL